MKKTKKITVKSVIKTFFIVLGTLIIISIMTCLMLGLYAASYIQDVIEPQVAQANLNQIVSSTDLTSEILYYDEDAEEYKSLQTLYATENRVWISIDDMPENLLNATVAIEDKRFYEHNGVDWKRTAAACLYMLTGKTVQGGSTITQQLIKNLTNQNQITVSRKILEIFEALEFDKTHTKQQILEWYLNEIYLGRGCYGVKTASEKYFGKDVGELDLAECAALISITNNPSLYDPYNYPENNLKRRTLVLENMCEQGYISESEKNSAISEEINFTSKSNTDDENSDSSTENYYSWYVDAVIESIIDDLMSTYNYDERTATQMVYSGGLKIYSCINPKIQSYVDEVYTSDIFENYDSNDGEALQSAITVVDNETGAVVALSGGMGEKIGDRIWNRATDTIRQPGSSIKPLSVYSQAIERGLILPNTIIEDSAFTKIDGSDWPNNSHGGYSGDMDITYAVAQSVNTVAVKVLDKIGLYNSFYCLTDDFNLTTLLDDYTASNGKTYSDVGYSQLALGGLTNGVSTYEMASAYSTFTRNGVYVSPYLYSVVINSTGSVLLNTDGYNVEYDKNNNVNIASENRGIAILKSNTCFYMNELLEEVVLNGTGTSAAIDGMSVAGKTGTTNDDYDRWFVGYTPYYTAAVWSGYDQASKINAVSNPSVAVWQKVMSKVSSGYEDVGFDEDLDSISITYCTKCGKQVSSKTPKDCQRTMNFLQGDEPHNSCTGHSSSK